MQMLHRTFYCREFFFLLHKSQDNVIKTKFINCASVADLNPDPQDRLFLGLLDPDPDSLVRNTDTTPDPSKIKQKK